MYFTDIVVILCLFSEIWHVCDGNGVAQLRRSLAAEVLNIISSFLSIATRSLMCIYCTWASRKLF